MTEDQRARIVIVGAGLAGATLAYLLASRGQGVTLLERQSDFAREFRGEALTPSGVHALREMGLGGMLAEVPTALPQLFELYSDRQRVLSEEFDAEFFGDDLPLVVSQPHMLEAIIAAASKHSGFRFERGATLSALMRRNGRVAGVRARTEAGEVEFEADLVIGADGRGSRVRREAQFEVDADRVAMDVVRCKLPLPPSFEAVPQMHAYVGNGHLLICYRAPDDRLQLGWVILKGTWGELRSRGVESWVEKMANHVADGLASHHATPPMSWGQPGVFLIGDAAHTHSPVGAQGINIALRDSIVAANHLVQTLRAGGGGAELDAAAQRIEAERLPEVRTIQRLQAQPPKLVLANGWWGARARRLTKLLRFPLVRGIAARGVRPFAYGVTQVDLSV